MPKSSRHKSSKHTSKYVKDYSVSEKDSTSKDKRSRDEVGPRVFKDSSSSDKTKLDSKGTKDNYVTGNGARVQEHGSSKRRREKADDETTDRWNGGDDHDVGEGFNSKDSSDLKNKRKDEHVGFVADGEEGKKTAGKEGKYRESSGKEAMDDGAEREKKGREGRNERTVDREDDIPAKRVENTGSKNQIEGNTRKRRDGPGEGNKFADDTAGVNDRHRRDDSRKDGRQKSEKVKDDKREEKYSDDLDKESKHRNDKQRNKRNAKNHVSSQFDDERLKDDKYDGDIQNLRDKTRDSERYQDYNGTRDQDRDRDRGRGQGQNQGRGRDREREPDRLRYHDREDDRKRRRDHSHDHYRDRCYDQDSDGDRYQEQNQVWDHNQNHDRDQDLEWDRGCDKMDYDGSTAEDQSSKFRSREKKRSSDGSDDYSDVRSTSRRVHGPGVDVEKKSSSIDRVDYDAKRGGSQMHSTRTDAFISNNSHRESEDMKYRDCMQEQASKANYRRELTGSSGPHDGGSKYKSKEKLSKTDDGYFGEPYNERPLSSKASPLGLVDRSPSSASDERKHMNRTGVRRSLNIEESGRRSSSIDMRDFSNVENRVNRDVTMEKPLVDESSQAESSFYRVGLGPSAFSSGVDSPSFANSVEDNFKSNSASRYRRSVDPNSGRMNGNPWRGVANWTAPMPNGFIPFQNVPPHGGFQTMVPQFPSPPLFVRPLEINHSGMPYHMSDVDRFSSPFRHLGWPNVLDGSGPSNFHGWDVSNGVLRDDPLAYRRAEWDQNGRGWKGYSGDFMTDLASPSDKDDHGVKAHSDIRSSEPVNDMCLEDSSDGVLLHSTSNAAAPTKESSAPPPEPVTEKALSPKTLRDDSSFLGRVYLSKIEISADLTRPELYNQCMNLLETEPCLVADDDLSSLKLFKMGDRAGLRSSKIIRPPIKDFVFKKAMELYKKQMMKERDVVFVSEETKCIKSPTKDKVGGEQSPIHAVEKSENQVSVADVEMTEAIYSNLETREEEADRTMPGLNKAIQEVGNNENPNPTIADLNEVIEEVKDNENPDEKSNSTSTHHKEDGVGNESPSLAVIFRAEKQLAGDLAKGVVYGDGCSEESKVLMAGSNESESVIISRIHHSPESTH